MAIKTSPFDAVDLRILKSRIDAFAELLGKSIAEIESSGKPLFVFKKSSQVDGLRRLLSFRDELNDSLIAAQSGRPYTAETLKPRAVKNSPPSIPGVVTGSQVSTTDSTDVRSEADALEGRTRKRQVKSAIKKAATEKPSNSTGKKRKQG